MVCYHVIHYDEKEYSVFSLDKLYNIGDYNNIKSIEVWGNENTEFCESFKFPSNLKIFKCYVDINMNIDKFPKLPDTLEELEFENNGLIRLPKLPPNLKILIAHHNRVWFPPELPNSLVKLDLSYNGLISLVYDEDGYNKRLPDNLEELIVDGSSSNVGYSYILPSKLKYMSIVSCDLYGFCYILPDSLLEFDCSNNYITELPKLPPNLRVLKCSNNSIKKIPKLPSKLEKIDACDNALTTIEFLVSTELIKNLKDVCLCGNRILKLPDNILRYAKTDFNFARNPIEILFSKQVKSDRRGYDHQNYIRLINAVNTIENWYLNARYNPNHNYCKRKIMAEYDELSDERSNKRLRLL